MKNAHLLIILAYLVGVSLYGWYLNKKYIRSSDDFVAAGRSLPFPVLVGTLLATWMGSGMITGSANFVYTYGPIASIPYFIGEPIGLLLIALFLAKKVRIKEGYTVPQLIEEKYGEGARILVTICIVLAYVGIVSYQFEAGGHIFNMVTGMSVTTGTIISAIFVVLLTVTGGLVSVAYTDAIGTLIIFIAMLIGLPMAIKQAGGLTEMFAAIPAEKLTATGGLDNIQLLGFALPTIFLVLGDQNIYQRFAASKDPAEAKRSGLGLFGLALLLDILVVLIVVPAIVLYPNLENPDTAFFQVAMGLPTVVSGLLLACATALFITTADSYLLSAATNITYDVWERFIKKDATDEEKLRFTRLTIVVLSVIALALGTLFPSILSIQMYAYSMYGAAITPSLVASLFWDKATKQGGLASIIIGGASVLVWDVVLQNPMGWNSILVAGPLSILALVVVSLLTQGKVERA